VASVFAPPPAVEGASIFAATATVERAHAGGPSPVAGSAVAALASEPLVTADPAVAWPTDDFVVGASTSLARADELVDSVVISTADDEEIAPGDIVTPLVAPESAPLAAVEREEDRSAEVSFAEEPSTPAPRLPLAEGLAALQAAVDRDAIFETLCLMGRDRFEFVALFAVHGDTANARFALGADWFDRNALLNVNVDLKAHSALRAAVQTGAPFIGRVGDDETLGAILRFLDRPTPLPAALVPVVLRGRVVAVLYVDDGSRMVAADELARLAQAAAEASNAFLRLIKSKKVAESPSRPARAPEPPSSPPPSPPPSAAPSAPPSPPPVTSLAGLGGLADAALLVNHPSSSPSHVPVQPLGDGRSERGEGLGGILDVGALIDAVVRDDSGGTREASLLVSQGARAAQQVLARFPGPLKFGHRKLNTVGLPLAEHGPLVALAARFGATAVALLVPRLDDPSPDARYYAALVLGDLQPESAIIPLGHRLFDSDTSVRRAAVHALGRYPPSPTLRALLDLLRNELVSPDLSRQRHATVALGELRDAPSVPRLVDMLKHRDMETVDMAHRALVVITKQDFGTTRWRWRSWWEKNREQTRLDWLLGGLDQPSLDARRSAAEELSAIGTERFGFHAAFSRREREEASRRWAVWFQSHANALSEERKAP
jgi:hypothetical protein